MTTLTPDNSIGDVVFRKHMLSDMMERVSEWSHQ